MRYTPTKSELTSLCDCPRPPGVPTTCSDPAQNNASSSNVAANVGVATMPGSEAYVSIRPPDKPNSAAPAMTLREMRAVSARCCFVASSCPNEKPAPAWLCASFAAASEPCDAAASPDKGAAPASAQALANGSRLATAKAHGCTEQTSSSKNANTAATAVASSTPRAVSPCGRAAKARPHAASMQANGMPTSKPSSKRETMPYSAGSETDEPIASSTA